MKKSLAFIFLICFFTCAQAENFKEKPAAWILEKYDSTGLIYSRTLSNCNNGKIEFTPTTPLTEINRFFALVISSKISGKIINIHYTAREGSCFIDSFSA